MCESIRFSTIFDFKSETKLNLLKLSAMQFLRALTNSASQKYSLYGCRIIRKNLIHKPQIDLTEHANTQYRIQYKPKLTSRKGKKHKSTWYKNSKNIRKGNCHTFSNWFSISWVVLSISTAVCKRGLSL